MYYWVLFWLKSSSNFVVFLVKASLWRFSVYWRKWDLSPGVNICVCMKERKGKLRINYYFMALRSGHRRKKKKKKRYKETFWETGKQITVQGGETITRCSVSEQLIYWYIALDNSVVISGCRRSGFWSGGAAVCVGMIRCYNTAHHCWVLRLIKRGFWIR